MLRSRACHPSRDGTAVYPVPEMSRLTDPRGGDDYVEAARKHLDDAVVLDTAGRSDGCAYLTGYVVESALKSILLHEASWDATAKIHVASRLKAEIDRVGGLGHGLSDLGKEVAHVGASATTKSARYVPAPTEMAPMHGWKPSLRYRASGTVPVVESRKMLTAAKAIYQRTIGQMKLDGVL